MINNINCKFANVVLEKISITFWDLFGFLLSGILSLLVVGIIDIHKVELILAKSKDLFNGNEFFQTASVIVFLYITGMAIDPIIDKFYKTFSLEKEIYMKMKNYSTLVKDTEFLQGEICTLISNLEVVWGNNRNTVREFSKIFLIQKEAAKRYPTLSSRNAVYRNMSFFSCVLFVIFAWNIFHKENILSYIILSIIMFFLSIYFNFIAKVYFYESTRAIYLEMFIYLKTNKS